VDPSHTAQRAEEITAVVEEIRRRVRARNPNGSVLGDIPIVGLMPLVQARDSAEGKVAAIGTVNPRRGGTLNNLVQSLKRLVARSLNWHVREQVNFNRAVLGCVQATIEALNETNRAIVAVAGKLDEKIELGMAEFTRRSDSYAAEIQQLKDIRLGTQAQ
jgi:hypothetical protein